MEDEMLTISKDDLIDILTKGDIFHKDGIDIVLSRDGLSGVLKGVICNTESLKQKSEYYKDRCQQLKEEVESLNHLLDKYEEETTTDLGWGDDDDDYDILELRDQWDGCDDD